MKKEVMLAAVISGSKMIKNITQTQNKKVSNFIIYYMRDRCFRQKRH